MSLQDCQVIELPKIPDYRGNLTVIEGGTHIPFPIKRIYYLYDVPGGAHRGGHAHRELQQLMIAISGSFDVILDDGRERKTVHLNSASSGLLIQQLIWREIKNFSSGSVCLVLASEIYNENDYFRDYQTFQKFVAQL